MICRYCKTADAEHGKVCEMCRDEIEHMIFTDNLRAHAFGMRVFGADFKVRTTPVGYKISELEVKG